MTGTSYGKDMGNKEEMDKQKAADIRDLKGRCMGPINGPSLCCLTERQTPSDKLVLGLIGPSHGEAKM